MPRKLYCGVEGGASVSKLVLVSENGNVLCTHEGSALNYMLLGFEESLAKLTCLLEEAEQKAGLGKDCVFEAVGLCLSGCEEEKTINEYKAFVLERHSKVIKSVSIASDTVGPLYAASSNGGLVLISGTGSNTLLINPDGTQGRCGGWGHILGDEGSAWWISCRAMKKLFDHEDNIEKCPFDLSKVKEIILEHFKVSNKFGLLVHCYKDFDKTYFADLCLKLANAANKDGDPFCRHLFYEAGKVLASMVVALKPKVHKYFLENGLPIICVGSVFKSWHLLEKGFSEVIQAHYQKCTLWTLSGAGSAIGAAYFGAMGTGIHLPINRENFAKILHRYGPEENDVS